MQVTRGFLVLCLAIGLSESSPGPGQFRFSDILGPIRNMFGSRGQSPQGYTLKDLTGSETGKGHQNQGHQGQGQDDGYRPYFPASGDFDYPQGGPSQGFGKYPPGPSSRYPGSGSGPIGSPSNPSHSPPPNGMKAIGIPVYVKPGHEYGRGGPPGSSPGGGYRRPTRQESGVGLFSGFGGPSSSNNDDSPQGGGGFEGFPSYFGGGHGGGGPSSSYQGYQQERPSRPSFFGGGGPSSRGPPSGGLFSSGSSRPYRVAPSPHYGGSPSSSSSQGPSYYSSQGQGQGPQYYDDFQGGPQGAYDSREPEIITLDDVQKPFGSGPGGPPSSNHLAGFTNFEGPSPPQGHRGPHGRGPPRGYRGQSSSHRPSYPPHNQHQQSDENGPVIYRSNPMRPSTRPFGGPYGSSSSDEESSGPFGPSPQESGKVIFRPIDESLNPSGQSEEVYYGKPMMMSSSNDQKTWRKKSGGKRFRKFYKGGGNISSMSGPQRAEILDLEESRRSNKLKLKPILLESPTVIGGPMTKSESQISANYEPQQAASGHGHNDFHSNGDRILYHVSGHQGPYSYRFGYDTGHGYNRQFRHEEKDGHGHVKGKYGFMDKNGKMNVVNYQAHPKHGFTSERGKY